jgi:hypothetical protein
MTNRPVEVITSVQWRRRWSSNVGIGDVAAQTEIAMRNARTLLEECEAALLSGLWVIRAEHIDNRPAEAAGQLSIPPVTSQTSRSFTSSATISLHFRYLQN